MKVLATERLSQGCVLRIADAGHELDIMPALSGDELAQSIVGYDALIVGNATPVDRDAIEAGEDLKFIGCTGVNIDAIDIDAATECGVMVCNAPDASAISVAEMTFALLLSGARQVAQANASMHDRKWERGKFVGVELYGKTIAIVGLGKVGMLVAERAHAFGMSVVAYDPYVTSERFELAGAMPCSKLEDAISQADFVTVHLPRTRETVGMFGADEFSLMKPSAFVVNASRGGIFDVDALAEALESGDIAGAALDVFELEPCTNSPLHALDNVILTPHLGSMTREAKQRAEEQVAIYMLQCLDGEMVPTAVNMVGLSQSAIEQVSPYLEACFVAGRIIAQLATGTISALRITACGELASHELELFGSATVQGVLAQITNDKVNIINAAFLAKERGIQLYLDSEDECADHAGMVKIQCRAHGHDLELGCTVSGSAQEPKLVDFFGFKFDVEPSENMVVMQYVDVPGAMGKICSILGDAEINISTLQIRDDKNGSGIATAVLATDVPCTETVRGRLAKALDFQGIWYVSL